ncbi:hypothetical protein BU26DRAFT_602329 [Trematosphaeria pertusa]|uniref:Uncharacterized protein n=1 Tax=Trematosphaeria pertusa TaxID=390896 RepID=A0A6A6IN58_9PLEO|nr:uncharacterized protein BU26DRAFT_602329 [Trematosphaeria pertusa]KAF2251826.1 hypothetical protein BU26DRAFT_602329 [Trematosphaeria pertusa]
MKGCNTYSPSSSIEKQLSCVKGTHMRTAAWKREEDRSLERRSYVARQDFVVAYSRCGLTMENDKLITLAGIAQDVTAVTGNDFACGPSENHFLEEPLWRREPHIRPKRQLFPRVDPSHFRYYRNCEKRRKTATVEEFDLGALKSGQLGHAKPVLRDNLLQPKGG